MRRRSAVLIPARPAKTLLEGEAGALTDSAEVRCRGFSGPLQRTIADFGADVPFGKIPGKLREHYGIDAPISSSRTITLMHAKEVLNDRKMETAIPEGTGVAVLVAEMDGSMIPVVETSDPDGDETDRRTTRKVDWQEVRLCLAHPKGSVTPVYGATAGRRDELFNCAVRAGLGVSTRVHGVGDGAPWIANQISLKFGLQGSYLIDFYHVCDYLSAAGDVCARQDKKRWMEEQKERMKDGRWSEVLEILKPHMEAESVDSKNAPVRACNRYIKNRPDQFDYKAALEAGLPIGSGEVEASPRYVIQNRLKLSGAWWKPKKAEYMLAMRVLRANGGWDDYWSRRAKAA